MTAVPEQPMLAATRRPYGVPVTLGERLRGHGNALNALRLCFALLVIASHSFSTTGLDEPLWSGISLGKWALAGFFVISGYLIPLSALRTTTPSFLSRRARRIYPGFWVMLGVVAFVAAPLAAHLRHTEYLPGRAASFLLHNVSTLMLQGDIGPETADLPSGLPLWNAPMWSVAVEVVLYLLVAALMVPAWLRRRQSVIPAAMFLLAATLFATGTRQPAHDVALCLVFFAAGWLVAIARNRVRASWGTVGLAALAALAGSLAQPVVAALPFAVLVLALGAVLPVRRFTVNDVSYGTYLYGWPVQQLLVIGGVRSLGLPVMLTASLGLALAAGTASWFAVERRFLPGARRGPARTEALDPALVAAWRGTTRSDVRSA